MDGLLRSNRDLSIGLRCDPRWCDLYEGASKKSLRQFIKYDREHPEVYRLLYRFAKQARDSGCSYLPYRLHAREVVVRVETDCGEFKLSNKYQSLYARKLIYGKHPLHADQSAVGEFVV